METSNNLKNARNITLDERETDHVSAFIHMLAIGMMVLGVVFVTLDRYELLPQPFREPPQLPQVAA